jgi:hypothetical protein
MPFIEHASKAVIGWGAYLQIGATAGGGSPDSDTFENISELISFDAPEEQADDIEVTHFGSPDRTKEKLRGLIDAGEGSFSINYRPSEYANQRLLVALKASGEKRNIRFFLAAEEEQLDFIGYIKSFKRNTAPGEANTADVTVTVAGHITSSLDEAS